MYANSKKAKDVYRGIIPLATQPDPRRGEIVLFDMVKFGPQADSLRKRGFKVIGASRLADRMEIDRPYGAQVMKNVGIRIPETHVFRSIGSGQQFLESHRDHWYYKPSGNMSCDTTHNGESDDLIRYLEYCRKEPPEQFELQKRVEGTEISLEGWFDGRKWVWPFNSTIEDKKFLTGDLGPRTGCMANVVWAYEESRPLLALKTLTRCAPYLEEAGYVGPIDLNMILDKEGTPYGLEWSPRFGYDALQALSLLIQGDFGHQLAEFASGSLDAFNVRTDAYAFTLQTSVPPYPNWEHAQDAKGLPLDSGLLKDDKVFLRDVMLKDGKPLVSGADASVATIGAVGTDLDSLRKELKEKASGFHIPNTQFRTDPVLRAEKVLTALSSLMYEGPSVRIVPESIKDIPAPRVPRREAPQRMVPGDNTRVVNSNQTHTNPNWEAPTHD
jgi:phosphoribosylamine--glycine ligase